MKKITLFLLLISSLYAQSQVYVGVSSGVYNESFNEIDATNSAIISTLKVGYGNKKAYSVEFSLDYMPNDSKIFSSSPDATADGDRLGFNVNLQKSFDFNIYVLPYVKVGFGTGVFSIERKLQDKLSYGSFQFTLGSYLPLSKDVDLELGYEVRHTSYEAINVIVTKTSYTSIVNIAYFGINYRF